MWNLIWYHISWYHGSKSMISYTWCYDINDLWYHRLMISHRLSCEIWFDIIYDIMVLNLWYYISDAMTRTSTWMTDDIIGLWCQSQYHTSMLSPVILFMISWVRMSHTVTVVPLPSMTSMTYDIICLWHQRIQSPDHTTSGTIPSRW